LAIVFIWLIMGMFLKASLFVLIPVSILLFMKQRMYIEVLVGFWFILILSDSFLPSLSFAKDFKVIYVLLFAGFIMIRRGEMIITRNQIITLFLPYFLLAFLMCFRSPEPAVSFQKALSYFLMFMFIPSAVNYFVATQERDFYRKLIFFGTFLSLLGLFFKYTGADWVYLADRFRGLLGNPNGLGLFSALLFILFLVISNVRPDTFTRGEKLTIGGIVLFNIIICQSRTALFTVLIFYMFTRLYKLSPFLGFVVLVISLAAYQTLILNLPVIIEALDLGEYMRLETLDTGSGRFIAWNFAWTHIQEHILFGKGLNYTEFLFKENYRMLSPLGHEGNAHNSYLTFWLDVGIFGLIAYLLPFILLILKGAKRNPGAMPFFFAILFSTYFESWLTASLNPFTIVFLIVLSILTSEVRGQNKNVKTKALEPILAT